MMQTEIKTGYAPQMWEETLSDGSAVWCAQHPDMPAIIAQAPTKEEALDLFDEMRESYFEHLLATGQPLPAPQPVGFCAVYSNAMSSETVHLREVESESAPTGVAEFQRAS